MARVRGAISLSSSYEVTVSKPMDARMLVPSYADLLDVNNWLNDKGNPCCYNGMIVAVASTSDASKNGLYMLLDASSARQPNASVETNWIKIGETSDISEFVGRLEEIEGNIAELAKDVTALEEVDNVTQEELDAYKDVVSDAIAGAKQEAIDAAAQAVADAGYAVADDIATTYATKQSVTDLSNTVETTLKDYAKTTDVTTALALKADASSVYTKTEADAEFMTESEVDARINAIIVAADPEGGKTISDIQNLVKYVDENAGEIASLVTTVGDHTTAINKNTEDISKINTTIAAIVQPKASEEITVEEDGTLGIGKVSTDKIEIGELTLVLDGGSAQ